ncbi:MAG: cytochrome b N-terminal domain-containing protein [Planctomycetales bacterium]|nr:cytochrome b N-terminal domain-containing protein [Planctomycetales bacterium]MBN8624876.1 cytochrome b N-terminal domain-containing protein [Planctomycetota bacterium]
MRGLFRWIEDRTGIGGLMHEALYERVPGGARWRYVWGSTLVFAFAVQAITGTFLWMAYSPSSQTAWESTYYIQHQMQFGWLLRGLHHYMAQTMVVLLALHLFQVVIDGAYKAPREFNFWLGLILMQIVLALALTGYLLPWDQRGYWSTGVATSLMSLVPIVGEPLQKLVVGGGEYGHHTLTRFFALHAGVLPATLVAFLVLHVAIFRKHGIHPKKLDPAKDCYFWPDQVLRDAVACLAVLLVVLFCIAMPVIFGHDGTFEERMAAARANPGAHLGAHLTAPADPSNAFSAARPEWYFLFLFQFLKFFHGEDAERIGALYIPGAVMGVLFLMPILGRWKLGHRFNVLFLVVLLAGAGYLTAQAWHDDNMAGVESQKVEFIPGFARTKDKLDASKAYITAVRDAEDEAHRAVELVGAPAGIPPQGAVALLRKDAKTQGARLFRAKCASCHSASAGPDQGIIADPPSAPNLHDFGSPEWIAGLLDPKRIDTADYFGNTAHGTAGIKARADAAKKAGEDAPGDESMTLWVKENYSTDGKSAAEKKEIEDEIRAVSAALAAEAGIEGRMLVATPDLPADKVKALVAKGQEVLKDEGKCAGCHKFGGVGDLGIAPDLTGYGSKRWLLELISNPAAERHYADQNDRMPAFAKDADPKNNQLSPQELELLVNWLRGEWYRPTE